LSHIELVDTFNGQRSAQDQLVLFNNVNLNVSKTSFVKIDAAYPPLEIIGPKFISTDYLNKFNYEFNLSLGKYNDMNKYLCSNDWPLVLLRHPNVSLAVDTFYDIVYNTIKLFILKSCITTSTFPKWYSKELKKMSSRII